MPRESRLTKERKLSVNCRWHLDDGIHGYLFTQWTKLSLLVLLLPSGLLLCSKQININKQLQLSETLGTPTANYHHRCWNVLVLLRVSAWKAFNIMVSSKTSCAVLCQRDKCREPRFECRTNSLPLLLLSYSSIQTDNRTNGEGWRGRGPHRDREGPGVPRPQIRIDVDNRKGPISRIMS